MQTPHIEASVVTSAPGEVTVTIQKVKYNLAQIVEMTNHTDQVKALYTLVEDLEQRLKALESK